MYQDDSEDEILEDMALIRPAEVNKWQLQIFLKIHSWKLDFGCFSLFFRWKGTNTNTKGRLRGYLGKKYQKLSHFYLRYFYFFPIIKNHFKIFNPVSLKV